MTMKEKNSNRKQKLMELFDIAKYADRIEDEKMMNFIHRAVKYFEAFCVFYL